MNRPIVTLAILALLAFGVGCNSNATTASASFTGTWQGNLATAYGSTPSTLVLTQSGNSVSGTITNASGAGVGNIPMSGTVSGNTVTLTFSGNDGKCLKQDTGVLNGNTLSFSGTFTCTGSGGFSNSYSGTFTRS